MAEQLTVTRPDGKQFTVSRKFFEKSLRGKGFTEGEAAGDSGDNTGKTYASTVSTKPKPKTKSTLTPDVVANGPSEKTK